VKPLFFIYRASEGSEGEEEGEEKRFFFRLVFDSTNEVLFALLLF